MKSEELRGKRNQFSGPLEDSQSAKSAQRLWLIGGTQESAQLAAEIAQTSLACTITVTTSSAKSLYPQADNIRVWVGKMNPGDINAFIQQEAIGGILDASHPFAVAVSELAIATAQRLNIPYLRYERPRVEEEGGEIGNRGQEMGMPDVKRQGEASPNSKIQTLKPPHPTPHTSHPSPHPLIFDSFETLLATDHLAGKHVLLTVGYRPLTLFRPWQNRAMLFARILPSLAALEAALAAGFTSDRLIALRPPISAAIEQALWREWNVSLVVTKASGRAGGEDIKRQIAALLGIQLVIINRPALFYPQQTSDLAIALSWSYEFLVKVDLKGMPSIR